MRNIFILFLRWLREGFGLTLRFIYEIFISIYLAVKEIPNVLYERQI